MNNARGWRHYDSRLGFTMRTMQVIVCISAGSLCSEVSIFVGIVFQKGSLAQLVKTMLAHTKGDPLSS